MWHLHTALQPDLAACRERTEQGACHCQAPINALPHSAGSVDESCQANSPKGNQKKPLHQAQRARFKTDPELQVQAPPMTSSDAMKARKNNERERARNMVNPERSRQCITVEESPAPLQGEVNRTTP